MTKMSALQLIPLVLWTCSASVHASGRDGALRHDVFSRPSLSSPPAAPAASAGLISSTTAEDAAAFWRPHLRAIIVAGPGSMVMLDRSVVAVGEAVEGYRLETVAEDRAVFVKGRKRVTLHLDRSGSVE